MSTPPKNISSDDAAIFSANLPPDNPDSDDGSDTEDPIARGASKIGQLDMFHGYSPDTIKPGVRKGNAEPRDYGFQLTPGAKTCDTIAPTDRRQGNTRRFA